VHILKYQFAQVEDGGEILVHLCLEVCDLVLSELTLRVVKDFFGEHLENAEIVLADVHVVHGGVADVVDEGSPGGIPLVLDDLDEDAVAFGEDVLHRPLEAFDLGVLHDQVDDEGFEVFALLLRQH